MQLGILNLLLGTSVATPAQGGEGEAGQGNNLFSQMLGADAQGHQGKGWQQGALTGEIMSNALLAQDLSLEQLASLQAGDKDMLARLLATQIGPEQANALIEKINGLQLSLGKQSSDTSHEAWQQLKEALGHIEASGEPQEVAEILESLPMNDSLDATGERAPVLQRMLQWLNAALDKRKEAPTPANADAEVAAITGATSATALSLQASIFRTDDATVAPADTGEVAATQEEKTREVIEIIPLSQQVVSIPEWVRKLGGEQSNAALDEAIPPLALKGEEALPLVDLPEVDFAGFKPVAPKAAPEFLEQLKPLTQMDSEQALSAPVTETTEVSVQGVRGTTHQVGAAGSYKSDGHSAVTPQVGATEQVHVAITRAKDDGLDRITLQLEPADLGRVEVKMDLLADGRTRIAFLVDKPETLEQLARDARALERALQEAGVKSDAGNMQFNLRQQPQLAHDGMNGEQHSQQQLLTDDEHASLGAQDNSANEVAVHTVTLNVATGVDIRA